MPKKEAKETQTSNRKADHIRINLHEDVQSRTITKFDDLYFVHQALPEFNLKEISTEQKIFSKTLKRPFLISSMTGGTPKALVINQRLARAAQQFGLAMGLGSQRAAIENPELAYTFQVRDQAPDILLFANLGAVQLNYGYSIDHCIQAVEMIDADALILHLNPLQEALQPEGQTNFEGLLNKIEWVCKELQVPVIVKEVGWGIAGRTAEQLFNAGVAAIDVAGAGGTSWARVEMHRAESKIDAVIAEAFDDWGISTVESIRQVKQVSKNQLIFASGGLRNGIDIAKSIALGANIGGIAGKFLKAANEGEHQLEQLCNQLEKEFTITMFASGAKTISDLKRTEIYSHELK